MAYQLHLQIDDALRRDLQAYAAAYGITLAAAVRILLRDGLLAAGLDGKGSSITRRPGG
jgi:antitoxin component of RelBE/YafQ-DinJ toxin-antitoxin module